LQFGRGGHSHQNSISAIFRGSFRAAKKATAVKKTAAKKPVAKKPAAAKPVAAKPVAAILIDVAVITSQKVV